MSTIQDDIEYYTKIAEKGLSFNDQSLDIKLAKSHISVDKNLTDIEFITIQIGFVSIVLQSLDAGLDILINKHKLPKVDFGTPISFRNKRLYDHNFKNKKLELNLVFYFL